MKLSTKTEAAVKAFDDIHALLKAEYPSARANSIREACDTASADWRQGRIEWSDPRLVEARRAYEVYNDLLNRKYQLQQMAIAAFRSDLLSKRD